MLYSDPSSGYQARLNHAMLAACSQAQRYLAVELFDECRSGWREQMEAYLDRTQVRDLVLVPPMCDSPELHDLLRQRGVNTVLISPSSPVEGASSIYIDDRAAAMEVTQHLIDLGHRRIGHIAGDQGHVATVLRQQGYRAALDRTPGASFDESLVKTGKFHFKDALDVAEEMLSAPNRPTAIFAANDDMAAAVVMVANKLGLEVPRDLSVAGFDNAPISQTMWPALTTVSQPFNRMAESAVRLASRGREASGQSVILPHELVVRASTGPAPKSV
nr:substrate-binding domain-containing protein [Sphingomicrobium nitratireducens]